MQKKRNRSSQSIVQNAKALRQSIDKTWALASKAPMFSRKSTHVHKNGQTKTSYRTARLIRANTFKVAACGAAMCTATELNQELKKMNVKPLSESRSTPCVPTVSKGMCIMTEQWLCAYVQQVTLKAHAIMNGMNKKRMTEDIAKLAFEDTNSAMFGDGGAPPGGTVVLA